MGTSGDKTKDKTKLNKGIEKQLRLIAILPMLLMGLVVLVVSYFVSIYIAKHEVERNLRNVAESIEIYYDRTYPGDFGVHMDDTGVYRLCKGGVDIMDTNDVLDEYKEKTGTDVTVFYMDVRMMTSIFDDGKRVIRTAAQTFVSDEVIRNGKECFYDNVIIGNQKYFGFYTPIINADGTIVGMFFAGKPTGQVEKESMTSIVWVPVVMLVFAFLGVLISKIPAKDITDAIGKEKKFLGEIASGNLGARIDDKLILRKDELGDMAKFTNSVQKFIREMIERDTLTRLFTRRVGYGKIRYAQSQLTEAGVPYCIGMGDIDFFKKFNDTYGHDCGDLVLREVARIFLENMIGKGFTIRWGGEEFLIVYEDATLEKAYEHLCSIKEKIINYQLDYNGQKLSVTMTFGLTRGDSRDIDDIVKEADNLLYFGKQNGRNQIVTIDSNKPDNADEADLIPEKPKKKEK